MMDYYVDSSAFIYPTFNWANVAPFEPKMQEQKAGAARTEFAAAKSGAVDFFIAAKGPLAPTSTRDTLAQEPIGEVTTSVGETATPVTAAIIKTDVDVDRIATQRVRLMAAKYAGGPESSEIVARLEILNRRLLEQSPRVSKEQVFALENASEQLARIKAAREERSKRLGIAV